MQHPEYFTDPVLGIKVFKLLGTYKFRLTVRRFIYDVFDTIQWNEISLKQLDVNSE
jgi:hypothetical protein